SGVCAMWAPPMAIGRNARSVLLTCSEDLMNALTRMERMGWTLLLLTVPISASPFLPVGSGTLVRPLALIPALALLGSALLRFLILRQRPNLPPDAGWLLGLFTLYVTATGLVESSVMPGNAFKGQTPTEAFLRAVATLAIGLVFYCVARLHLRGPRDIGHAILWLFAGLSASIALAVIQLLAIVSGGLML